MRCTVSADLKMIARNRPLIPCTKMVHVLLTLIANSLKFHNRHTRAKTIKERTYFCEKHVFLTASKLKILVVVEVKT